MHRLSTKLLLALGAGFLFQAGALANIVYDAPNGLTAPLNNDARWNSTVQWNVASGTVIAPNYFLTAQHFDGNVGDPVSLTTTVGGVTTTTTYTTAAQYNIPNSDLRVIQITGGTFPASSIVSLYTGGPDTETGQNIYMFGYGPYVQGSPIVTNSVQNGWTYGTNFNPPANAKNYGLGVADGVANGIGPGGENMIYYNFGSGHQQSIYGPGDSGGGMFIYNNNEWEVAGVAYGVSDFYTYDANSNTYTPISGAIYNPTNLYENNGTDANPIYVPATTPQLGFASEVAPFVGQIDAITGTPEPGSLGLLSFASLFLLRRKSRG